MKARKRRKAPSRRRRLVRLTGRVVLLVGIAVALLAPIAWERLPDYHLVTVAPPTDQPAAPPGPGITPPPGGQPQEPKIIRPRAHDLPSDPGTFAYFDFFGGLSPYVSNCDPVPFVIRTSAAPANGDQLVFEALQRLADSTGLSFEFRGFTDEIYSFNKRRFKFGWEKNRQPLWIGWASNDEVPDLGDKAKLSRYAVGLGGPLSFQRPDGQFEILGGGVVLRAQEPLLPAFGVGANGGNVLLHELGHAFGLNHVNSRAEQLYPEMSSQAPDGYGPGDQHGLGSLTKACG